MCIFVYGQDSDDKVAVAAKRETLLKEVWILRS